MSDFHNSDTGSVKTGLIYVRYSPRRDEQCDSLETQEDYVRRYFEFCGIGIGRVIRDPDTSARLVPLSKRKGGAELLSLTTGARPAYSIVGAYRLDRLWREVIDGISTLDLWNRAGVSVHLAAEGGQSLNTATATGRLIVNILLARAAYEPELTAERTSAAMLLHQEKGRLMSKVPRYGYRECAPVEVDGKIRRMAELDEAEQAVIARVRALRDSNGHSLGLREIARLLNSEGLTFRGRPFNHRHIKRICARGPVHNC